MHRQKTLCTCSERQIWPNLGKLYPGYPQVVNTVVQHCPQLLHRFIHRPCCDWRRDHLTSVQRLFVTRRRRPRRQLHPAHPRTVGGWLYNWCQGVAVSGGEGFEGKGRSVLVAVVDDRGQSGYSSESPPSEAPGEDFGRQPPQDMAAEQSVLGGMLLSKDAIADERLRRDPGPLQPR